jgi:hypothetical protein
MRTLLRFFIMSSQSFDVAYEIDVPSMANEVGSRALTARSRQMGKALARKVVVVMKSMRC